LAGFCGHAASRARVLLRFTFLEKKMRHGKEVV